MDGAVIGNLTVIDPNEQDSHTLSVDDPRFEIVNGQLKLKDGVSLDHESAEAVTVNVTATDVLGLSVTQTIIIAVNDVNEAPTAISLGNASVDENASGAVIGNVTVADVDDGDSHSFALDDGRFEIVNGQLRLKDGESLDFEVEDQVEITVTATDSGGLSTSETFAITVNDLNDVPVIGSPGLTVSEGALVTVTAADLAVADADDADSAVTVQVSGVTGGQFENTAAPGTAITQFTLADVAANSIQFVHDGGEAAPTFSVAAKGRRTRCRLRHAGGGGRQFYQRQRRSGGGGGCVLGHRGHADHRQRAHQTTATSKAIHSASPTPAPSPPPTGGTVTLQVNGRLHVRTRPPTSTAPKATSTC